MLEIISIYRDNNSRKIAKCKCYCGKEFESRYDHVKSNGTRSCGCLRRGIVRNFKHGHNLKFGGESPTYKSWHGMKTRCLNSNASNYHLYGGRGIKICERWMKFENFLEDMGERPEGLTLDRVNNNGHYEPSNCKWSTLKEQANNRRKKSC